MVSFTSREGPWDVLATDGIPTNLDMSSNDNFIGNSSRIKSYKAKAMEIFFVKRAGWPTAALVLISARALGL